MIVRRGERPRKYTVIPNDLLENEALTWESRGLLAYLLSKPDSWHVNRDHLAAQAPNGVRSVRTILGELERLGYLVRRRHRGEDGRIAWECVVYDQPMATPIATTGAIPTDGTVGALPADGLPAGGERAAIATTEAPTTEEQPPAAPPPAKVPLAERDPLMATALELTKAYWEWCKANDQPRPTVRLDGSRSAFIAVAQVVRGQLEMGWTPDQLAQALHDTAAFTTNAITVALRRKHRQGPVRQIPPADAWGDTSGVVEL